MQATIDETERRRAKQIAYNQEHNIVPTTAIKSDDTNPIYRTGNASSSQSYNSFSIPEKVAAEEENPYKMLNKEQLQANVKNLRKQLEIAVKDLDFMKAADLRNRILLLEEMIFNY